MIESKFTLSRFYWKKTKRKEGRKEGRQGRGKEGGREGGKKESPIIPKQVFQLLDFLEKRKWQ